MDEQDIYSQVPIEKREVYANNQNREIFLETVQNLGLTERDMSVPFVLDKRSNTYVVGTQPAMDMFEEYINQQQNPEPIIDVTNSWTTVEVVENIGNALEVEVIDTSTPSTQSE